MLASTIQFTTNPPTPTHNPQQAGAPDRSGNQGALPQNPDSMPPPHTPKAREGTHHQQTTTTITAPAAHHSGRVFYASTRQANHPAHQCTTVSRPAFREEQPPAGPDPFNGPDNNDQEATPTQHQSLERR